MTSFSGLLPLAPPPSPLPPKTSAYLSCTSHRHPATERSDDTSPLPPQKFTYSRASPSVRWPHLNLPDASPPPPTFPSPSLPPDPDDLKTADPEQPESPATSGRLEPDDFDSGEDDGILSRPSRTRVKKMNKLALSRDKQWRDRVKCFSDRILGLGVGEFVSDVLEDDGKVQMSPADLCHVVKTVGGQSWERGLEVYEWLNVQNWYCPSPQMLATVLGVLGKAGQISRAADIFERGEAAAGDSVQVYNAMMGVYARGGQFEKARQLFEVMRERDCEPDLVSFNTLINARLKSKEGMTPGLALELLEEVRRSKIRPDIITYNTLISACSRGSNLKEAMAVHADMTNNCCQPDIWTYNAMISVYARCGMPQKAEEMFEELQDRGFMPDAVSYNSLLYAFAREGSVDKVRGVCDEMVKEGFVKHEMTYNTMIHMYGKQGQWELALKLYREMQSSGRTPDAVTYTILIDSLGKACKIEEAAAVMSEMLDSDVKPNLRTYSALMCGYAKVGRRGEAEETFNSMLKSRIRPDQLAYSVMLDIFLRSNEPKKAMMLYKEMICDGVKPDPALYQGMLRTLKRENRMEEIGRIIKDMKEFCGFDHQAICSILVKGECYDAAAEVLGTAISDKLEIDNEVLVAVLGSYSLSGRYSEALDLLGHCKNHLPKSSRLITEASIVMLCKDHQLEAALREYHTTRELEFSPGGYTMYEALINCCKENKLIAEAFQVFSDMRFYGIRPSASIYQTMVFLYANMGFPETAHHLIDLAETEGTKMENSSIYAYLVEVYGNLKLWQKAERLVETLKHRSPEVVNREVWNALIQAYAASGCYERARAVFNTMMRDGPPPTVESMNGLLQALIVDGRLEELYVVIQDLQDMGFKISRTSIILMLDAFTMAGNIFEMKKIYHGMRAAGYLPTMHLYRTMIRLLCRGKQVRDAEAMILEMEEGGFRPDLSIWNSMLKLYTITENFRKTAQVYQRMIEDGIKPDDDTYNTLIIMYCRDYKPEEGLLLMREMQREGLEPKLDTYKSLICSFGKMQQVKQAEELFEGLMSKGCKLDRSFYHSMMKIYRDCGSDSKALNLLNLMKDAGVEPSTATMHLLMVSYGSSGKPREADKVLTNLKETGLPLTTLPYASVLDAYLKNREYNLGIQKLKEMREEGIEPDHRVWTCFVRAASLCQHTNEAILLLNALKDVDFDLPIRLLTEKPDSLVAEVDDCLQMLESMPDDAVFNFVNALEDLLWAFEVRATASWLFQLAMKRGIYRRGIFRVTDKDWGADFRKLSAGAALVGLTLWLDHMQDASLEGYPESPKIVVLITGASEYNMVSLNSTIKACLWEMAAPFFPNRTRTGLLVAKAHSLKMWLKDSPFCLDLELRNAPTLPELNSMQLVEGCFIRRDLVPAFIEINEKLGNVRPKLFAKLALLSDAKRGKVIRAHIEGGREKAEKAKNRMKVPSKGKGKTKDLKYVQRSQLPNKDRRLNLPALN